VALAGALESHRLREEYREADIFFFPSTFEGSPKVVVEAAACALPVIVRDTYSAETVVHGVTGFQAVSDDEMFSYLALLLEKPELRRRLGEAGRQHSRKYDWDGIAQQWSDAFRLIAGSRLRSAS
jgi:glycosyltransferase involved in cell wall biosynthesis